MSNKKMKAYFVKHCFGLSIKINDIQIDASSEDWHKDFKFINTITIGLLPKIDTYDLEVMYRQEISHDYTNPINKSREEMLDRLTSYFKYFDLQEYKGASFHYFNLLSDLLNIFANDIEYTYCEQCGDQNYDFSIELDKI